jgi:hypothetical protein
VQLHRSHRQAKMEANGQLHVPEPFLSGKLLTLPVGQETGWAPKSAWIL